MRKKPVYLKLLLFAMLTMFVSSAFRTEDVILIKTIPVKADFITSDLMHNLYIVQHKKLEKYDENGTLLNSFDHKQYGLITTVDVTNPLKILVYYKDFNMIVFLDKTLSISGSPILLDKLGIEQSSAACTSYGNAFWVYDHTLSRLVRFDKNLLIQNQSNNVTLESGQLEPVFMTERNNILYIADTAKGVLLYDNYGAYSKTIPLKGLNYLNFDDNQMFYLQSDSLKSLNLMDFSQETIALPDKNVKIVTTSKNYLYAMYEDNVSIYKYTPIRKVNQK